MVDELFRLHCLYEEAVVGDGTEFNGFRLILYNDGSGMVGGTKAVTGELEWTIIEWETIEEGIGMLRDSLAKRGVQA